VKYLFFLSAFLLLNACASKHPTQSFEKYTLPTAPNYADLATWAAHPDKKDLADLVPINSEAKDEQKMASVDVFFLHPTGYLNERGNTQWNADVNDEALNVKTDNSSIQFQASIFNGVGRIYAPRYRQAHLYAYYSKDRVSAKKAFEVAYSDVKTAFQHYLEHWNQGRPFIIAAHSQGTQHAVQLMKELVDETNLRNRLVVAYVVGMPVPKKHFKNIPVCDKPEQTGCFCSWRTFKTGYEPKLPNTTDIAVVNPLSMTTELGVVGKEKHEGGVLMGFKKTAVGLNNAEIHKGILWIEKPRFRGSRLYFSPNYHAGDFNLFYFNVRNDAKRREGLFWKR
jgi:Protein of unknown function (DUF3089)